MGKFSGLKKIPFLGTIIFRTYMRWQRISIEKQHRLFVENMNLPKGKKILYLDVPIHSNLGDLAQYVCTKHWISMNYPDRLCIEIDGLLLSDLHCGILEKMKAHINKEDIIVFQSGYCTQDLGGYHDLVHRLIVEKFPNTPIVMLPQTVYYQDKDNAKRTARVYEKHNKIFFMARDFTSAEIAKNLFGNLKIYTYPDIVTTLIGTRKTSGYERNGVAFCIRNDSEKFYSDQDIQKLYSKLSQITKVSIYDTTLQGNFKEIQPYFKNLIYEMIDQLCNAKVVITDRYHGTIFSLIAGTPVIVIKTKDHKVKTGVEWFAGIYDDYVHYADTLEDAFEKANQLLNKEMEHQLYPYFKEHYYDGLKEKISLWLNEL